MKFFFLLQENQSLEVPKTQKEVAGSKMDNSYGWVGNFMFLDELRKKIMSLRDIMDLPPCNGSQPIIEVLFILFLIFKFLAIKR